MGLSKNGPITPWKNSWAYKIAEQKGVNAGLSGEPYNSNPYLRTNPQHLVWSEAHNGSRARRLMDKYG